MPERCPLFDLPLLLTGVPGAVQTWLRRAGVPFAPFRLDCPTRSRIVLYDSRIVASRCDAEAARGAGLKTIDVLPLLAGGTKPRFALPNLLRGRPSAEPTPSRFFLRMKNSVERAGGVWARLGDYPFPWQGAACSGDGRFLPEFTSLWDLFPRPADGQNDSSDEAQGEFTGWIRERYLRGLPFSVPEGGAPSQLAEIDCPLLWRTSFTEFTRWWGARSRLNLQLRYEDEKYEFTCDGDLEGFRPTVELWQGDHVACLPLPLGRSRVRRNGLAFQYEPRRSPAGLAAHFAAERHEMSSPAWYQPQPA